MLSVISFNLSLIESLVMYSQSIIRSAALGLLMYSIDLI